MSAMPLATTAPVAHPTLTVDLAAVAANTRLLAQRATGELMAVVKADGFGHGAVDVARTALAARRHPARRHQHSRRRWRCAPAGMTRAGPELAQPGRRRLSPPRSPPTSRSPCPVAGHLEAVARAPGARVHLHLDTGMARDGAAPAGVGRPVPGGPAGRASRPGPRRRRDGPPRLRRHPRRPGQRPRPGPVRLGPGDGPLLRAAAASTGTWPPPPRRSPTRAATTR